MHCNYSCLGCYSRVRSASSELSTAELDTLFEEAEDFGILAVVVTGGEPFLRSDSVFLIRKHRNLLFVVITNGSCVPLDVASEISQSGNVIVLLSIEGNQVETDDRHGEGAHALCLRAMDNLKACGVLFGFAATNTRENLEALVSETFIDQMAA